MSIVESTVDMTSLVKFPFRLKSTPYIVQCNFFLLALDSKMVILFANIVKKNKPLITHEHVFYVMNPNMTCLNVPVGWNVYSTLYI